MTDAEAKFMIEFGKINVTRCYSLIILNKMYVLNNYISRHTQHCGSHSQHLLWKHNQLSAKNKRTGSPKCSMI